MLVIKFLRVGKKNQPSFQIVVAEKERGPKSGRFIEKVGFYNPLTKERRVDTGRVKYWLSVGAKPSDTVWNLLVAEKVVKGKKIAVHKKATKEPQETKAAEDIKEPEKAKSEEAKSEEKQSQKTEPPEKSEEAKETDTEPKT